MKSISKEIVLAESLCRATSRRVSRLSNLNVNQYSTNIPEQSQIVIFDCAFLLRASFVPSFCTLACSSWSLFSLIFNREWGTNRAERGRIGMWEKASRIKRDPESYGMNLGPIPRSYRSPPRHGKGEERRRDAPEPPARTRPCNPRPWLRPRPLTPPATPTTILLSPSLYYVRWTFLFFFFHTMDLCSLIIFFLLLREAVTFLEINDSTNSFYLIILLQIIRFKCFIEKQCLPDLGIVW